MKITVQQARPVVITVEGYMHVNTIPGHLQHGDDYVTIEDAAAALLSIQAKDPESDWFIAIRFAEGK